MIHIMLVAVVLVSCVVGAIALERRLDRSDRLPDRWIQDVRRRESE